MLPWLPTRQRIKISLSSAELFNYCGVSAPLSSPRRLKAHLLIFLLAPSELHQSSSFWSGTLTSVALSVLSLRLMKVCSSLSSPCLVGDSPGLLPPWALGLAAPSLWLQSFSLELWGLKTFSPSVVSVSLELLDATGGCLEALELRTLGTRVEQSLGVIESNIWVSVVFCAFASPQNCVLLIAAVEQVVVAAAHGQLGTHWLVSARPKHRRTSCRSLGRHNPEPTAPHSQPSQTQTGAHSFSSNTPVPLSLFFLRLD